MAEENQEIHANDLVWAYHPINPETDYSRRRYLFSQEQLNKIEEYTEKLKKDAYDTKTRGKLTDILFGDKNLGLRLPIEQLRLMAKNSYDNGSNEMARYVKRNLDDFFDDEVLTDEGLQHLLLRIPLYLIGNEKHDKLVKIITDYKEVSQIASEGDTGKMSKYIGKKLKEKKVPEWVAKTVSALLPMSGFAQAIFERYARASNQILSQNIMLRSGETARLNRGLLEDVIRDSIKFTEDKYEAESDEGKKGDIWDDDYKPMLYAMANEPFEYVKEKWERDMIAGIREREDERHAAQMAA